MNRRDAIFEILAARYPRHRIREVGGWTLHKEQPAGEVEFVDLSTQEIGGPPQRDGVAVWADGVRDSISDFALPAPATLPHSQAVHLARRIHGITT